MSDGTHIEWTDASWNPVRAWSDNREMLGWVCQRVSPGCEHCYAETINKRLGTGLRYDAKGLAASTPYLDEGALEKPLSWRKPRKVFVCSMTDLFGEWVLDEWIDRVFAVMALSPQHTFQVLTKRPERMRAYLSDSGRTAAIDDAVLAVMDAAGFRSPDAFIALVQSDGIQGWPLPNVWLMTSVENQEMADKRIPELLATPSALRGLSIEPLLGPVDLELPHPSRNGDCYICGIDWSPDEQDYLVRHECPPGFRPRLLDWVIVGGESGPSARPMDLAWARSLVAQCAAAGVACFVKQLGSKPVIDCRSVDMTSAWSVARIMRAGDPVVGLKLQNRKGGDMDEWPADLRVREFPGVRV